MSLSSDGWSHGGFVSVLFWLWGSSWVWQLIGRGTPNSFMDIAFLLCELVFIQYPLKIVVQVKASGLVRVV